MVARVLGCSALLALVACSTAPSVPADGGSGESVTLVTVFDGDSILVSRDGVTVEVRLLGINAPERTECFGEAATEELFRLLEEGPITMTPAGGEDRDRFDRLLRYVHGGGRLVNEEMIRSGHAVYLHTDHPRRAEFASAADAAFGGGAGLWAPTACGETGVPDIRIAEIEANPPGDDYDGEAVVIVNGDVEPVDLSGWVLRDSSSVHRFVFPAGFMLGAGAEATIATGCDPEPGVLPWCADGPVWNNDGDTAMLQTPAGSVVDRRRY